MDIEVYQLVQSPNLGTHGGDSGKESFPFNSKEPLAEPSASTSLFLRKQEKDTNTEGLSVVSRGRIQRMWNDGSNNCMYGE